MELNNSNTRIFKSMARVGGAIGKGLIAGFAGTVAITLSQMIEMQITKRKASSSPVIVGGKVLGVEPKGKAEVERKKAKNEEPGEAKQNLQQNKELFGQWMHYGYGTGWGVFRGALDLAKVNGKAADLALFGGIWGTAQVMIPMTTGSKPIYKWPPTQIAVDVLHHAVYALVAGELYEAMRKAEKTRKKKKKSKFLFL
ncbi:hypothetical protein [Salinimicrobium soli]|uniref:hypothetical protein n=1 Tax=Salinimicrobium soli TaxID=1254399 RepID=UPI003AACB4C8